MALLAITISLNCEPILSLDSDYRNVAEEMCQCDSVIEAMGPDQLGCIEIISNRIEIAGEQTRKAWFDTFISECAQGCGAYPKCLSKAPICAGTDEPCGSDAYCCSQKCAGIGNNRFCAEPLL